MSLTKDYILCSFQFSLRYGCQIWGQNQGKIVEAIERTKKWNNEVADNLDK